MLSVALPRPLRQRFERWFETRNPPSSGSILLHNRRLYILPTRFGYLFAAMLLMLFLAAINYQNSMAFVLTFMLTALGIISLWQTHKNLLGVSVQMQIPRPVFCGEDTEFRFEISHANNVRRFAIGIQYQQHPPVYVKLDPGGSAAAVLIYPRPAENIGLQHSLVEQYDGSTSTSTIEGDDFAGLREHREGESLRHISWKAYAQGKGLLTKTFQGHARPSLWIDWDLLASSSVEERLSHMTALVLAAESEEQKYGLRLPGLVIEQDFGNAHKHTCLQALAMFRQPPGNEVFQLESV